MYLSHATEGAHASMHYRHLEVMIVLPFGNARSPCPIMDKLGGKDGCAAR